MKAKCEESEAMNEFCDSCFRCKLGGVRQGGFVLAGGESDDSYDRINVVARDDLGSIRAIRNERDVFIGEAANLVHGARLDGQVLFLLLAVVFRICFRRHLLLSGERV